MTVRVGLVGAGRIGRQHAAYLARSVPEADFAAIADGDEALAAEVAAEYGIPASYPSLDAMAAATHLEAVVIATPTATHEAVIQAAAGAGLHIFCEKPLALTIAGCDAAIQAAESAGVRLMIGFMRRFDAAYLAAMEAINGGAIGLPTMFKASGRDPHRTNLDFARRESSGGLILDMAIPDFDLARWLMMDEITRVHAEGDVLAFPELELVGDIDNAVINLKFAQGAVGNIDVSRNAVYGADIRTEVLGSGGSVSVCVEDGRLLTLLRDRSGTRELYAAEAGAQRFAPAFIAELRTFLHSVSGRGEPPLSVHDARAATAVAVAATLSLDEQRVVEVSEVG